MSSFQLPFEAQIPIERSIIDDLDLKSTYGSILKSENGIGSITVKYWTTNYSADEQYLRDTQLLLVNSLPEINIDCSSIINLWEEVSNNEDTDSAGFHSQYQYIEWSNLKNLNYNENIMQLSCIYNITSPLLSLSIPIFFLIFPFLFLKMNGTSITFIKYIDVIKMLLKKHQLGKLMTMSFTSWDKIIYVIFSLLMYVVQIYHNIHYCIKFFNNMKVIHQKLGTISTYLSACISYMEHFDKQTIKLKTYANFRENMIQNIMILKTFQRNVNNITPFKPSISKMFELGNIMKCFYQLFNESNVKKSLEYSLLFCGYIDNLNSFKNQIQDKKLNKCMFTNKKTNFVNAFHPTVPEPRICNSYSTSKNMLITGPNASGKTTLLKTTLFNVIISQQIGFGYYDKAKLTIYHHIHSYLNIPDTSGRDSLFQSEAKRCKNILDCINSNGANIRHFCIFDELYSGTNHCEAVSSATSFLEYLSRYPNVALMITTHFTDLCKNISHNKKYKNCHMEVYNKNDELTYLYKIKKGISKIKGGVKVLQDLKYPQEIIDNTVNILKKYV